MWSQAAINIPHMAVAVSDQKPRNQSGGLRWPGLVRHQYSERHFWLRHSDFFLPKMGTLLVWKKKRTWGVSFPRRVSVTVYRFDSSWCITMWQWLWWFVLSMLTLDVGYVSSFHGCQERNKRVSGVDKGWRGWLGWHVFFLIRVRFAGTSLLPKCPNVTTQRVF